MITDKALSEISTAMADAFEEINVQYITRMSNHIKRIGRLDKNDLHRLEQMIIMNNSAQEINAMLAKQCKLTSAQLKQIYLKSGADEYDRLKIFYDAKGIKQIPFYENMRMMSYVESVWRLTDNAFENISRTTAIDKSYQKAVDRGIYAVSNGLENYNVAVRRAVKDSVTDGTKIEYASGYKRRLDSAARMNILDGVRQLNMGIDRIAGEEFGADGWEISAHALCATDHLPIQGLRLSNEEFEELNEDLVRPVGEMNCQHRAYPIVLGVSEPAYTNEEIEQYEEFSTETIEYDGKEITRYEASQKMRQIETKVRYQEEYKLAGKHLGDDALVKKSQDNIDRLKLKYKDVASTFGLDERTNRMRIPSKSKSYAQKVINQHFK